MNFTHTFIKITDLKNTIEQISNVSLGDLDFIGENGEDYLWEKAKGFKSNLEYTESYLLDKYKDCNIEKELKNIIKDFLDMWLANDIYYKKFGFSLVKSYDRYSLAVAFTTE